MTPTEISSALAKEIRELTETKYGPMLGGEASEFEGQLFDLIMEFVS